MNVRISAEEIEAGKSAAGGHTKRQLASWGVPYPPPSGWKQMLIDGVPVEKMAITADELLRRVVATMVEANVQHLLYDMPEVMEYFEAVNPSDAELAEADVIRGVLPSAFKADPIDEYVTAVREKLGEA